jgi:hypothetical protein
MVLQKPAAPVVQIGSVAAIKQATAGSNAELLTIKSNGGNGKANGNGSAKSNGNGASAKDKSATADDAALVSGD